MGFRKLTAAQATAIARKHGLTVPAVESCVVVKTALQPGSKTRRSPSISLCHYPDHGYALVTTHKRRRKRR